LYALMAGLRRPRILRTSGAFYGLLSHAHGILHDAAGSTPRTKRASRSRWRRTALPMLAFFGDQDTFIRSMTVRRLESSLSRARAGAEIVVVPGAAAFMNDTRPDAYRAEARTRTRGDGPWRSCGRTWSRPLARPRARACARAVAKA
jgi:pimeloyl-ACP methyl ester carboxylesterase